MGFESRDELVSRTPEQLRLIKELEDRYAADTLNWICIDGVNSHLTPTAQEKFYYEMEKILDEK